ncbi:MAG: GCN5-related N-acetyltransferase [Enterovirga sp.]|jgi:GNAT superfamily N-acetyltransferase|nr:GCN5-related N-acetyltransferase [Enterovirga sp.]
MSELTISIRRARSEDAAALSDLFDATWREAYQGILPALSLERMIGRRGPRWWLSTIGRSRPLVVLDVGETIAGYASYGRCRDRGLPADGEIDELYLRPEYQGLGFGKRLFKAVRNDLDDRGAKRVAVWCLSDNLRGCAFYRGLGGRLIAETPERFSGSALTKSCYLFKQQP